MAIIRAVLDTNVVAAGRRSQNSTSPNREILLRWETREFTLLFSDDIILEYIEKLLELGDSDEEVRVFVRAVKLRGKRVPIEHFHLRRYPSDIDDIPFVLCASNGQATHLVTYDGGFSEVAADYSFKICAPLAFLAALRQSSAP